MRKTAIKHAKEHGDFCAYLRKLRENFGYRQADVAQALNISRSQYCALENGHSMLTFDHLCGIAQMYKLELFELMAERY